MATFAQRFKELRLDQNCTQDKLAETFFLNKSSISRYESGKQIPETPMLSEFASYFGVSLDYLMGRTDIKNDIGNRLRQLRTQSGLTQKEVAYRIGINNKTLSGYENNVSTPDPETLQMLAKFYNSSTDYLISGEGTRNENKDNVTTDLNTQTLNYLKMYYGENAYKLIILFLKLNETGQSKILETITDYVEIPKYTVK